MNFNQSTLIEQGREVNICEHTKTHWSLLFCLCCLLFVVIVHRHSNTSCHWPKGEQGFSDTMHRRNQRPSVLHVFLMHFEWKKYFGKLKIGVIQALTGSTIKNVPWAWVSLEQHGWGHAMWDNQLLAVTARCCMGPSYFQDNKVFVIAATMLKVFELS